MAVRHAVTLLMTKTRETPVQPSVRPDPGALPGRLVDWDRSLRAAGRSPATRKVYALAGRGFTRFLAEHGMPTAAIDVHREHVEAFLVDLADNGAAPATCATRYRALVQFFKWLAEEGEITRSPMVNMKQPSIPETPVPVLSEADLKALLATCAQGRPADRSFVDHRDNAILRMLCDTGMRRSELAGLKVDDIDDVNDVAHVLGKGNRRRGCQYGSRTAEALHRYLRWRQRHQHADASALWIGERGPLTGGGVALMLTRRARDAGLGRVHLHQLRHTFAHQWLADGGTEGDLMRLGGWRSRQMLDKYGGSVADERARDAHRTHGLGDRL
jgi:site-specific recombinase XerD